MHGAAKAATVATCLAKHIRQHTLRIVRPGKGMAMTTMMAEKAVARRQGRQRSNVGRLLADGQMQRATGTAHQVQLVEALFEDPDEQHAAEGISHAFRAKFLKHQVKR